MNKKVIVAGMVLVALVCFLSLGSFYRNAEAAVKKSARDLFFVGEEPQPGSPASAQIATPPGLNYQIIKLVNAPYGCDFQNADVKSTFVTGDRIKIAITANTNGYLYIFHQGASGAGQTLFPNAKINGGNNKIEQGVEYTIPGTGWWEFKPPTGVEKINIFLCEAPIQALSAYVVPTNPQPVPDAVIVELQRSAKRDLQFVDTAPAPQVQGAQVASPIQSYFVVNTAQVANPIVAVELNLIHQ